MVWDYHIIRNTHIWDEIWDTSIRDIWRMQWDAIAYELIDLSESGIHIDSGNQRVKTGDFVNYSGRVAQVRLHGFIFSQPATRPFHIWLTIFQTDCNRGVQPNLSLFGQIGLGRLGWSSWPNPWSPGKTMNNSIVSKKNIWKSVYQKKSTL